MFLFFLRDVPLGLPRDIQRLFAMLATVPGMTMPDIPSVGHELPATRTSANPPVFTFGWLRAEHSDPGGLDPSPDHQSVSWVIHRRGGGRGRGRRCGGCTGYTSFFLWPVLEHQQAWVVSSGLGRQHQDRVLLNFLRLNVAGTGCDWVIHVSYGRSARRCGRSRLRLLYLTNRTGYRSCRW